MGKNQGVSATAAKSSLDQSTALESPQVREPSQDQQRPYSTHHRPKMHEWLQPRSDKPHPDQQNNLTGSLPPQDTANGCVKLLGLEMVCYPQQ